MHKHALMMLGAGIASLAGGELQAQTRPGLEVNAEVYDYSYLEEYDGETVVRDDGAFGGLGIGYVQPLGGRVFIRGRLTVAFGSVDYRGAGALDENSGLESRIDNVSQDMGQLEIHLGGDVGLDGDVTLSPFIGLGSRVLLDNSGGEESSDGLQGYDREISFGYIPVGAAATVPLDGGKSIILSGQLNLVVNGRSKSKFSDLDAELPDIEVELDKGTGLELSALLSLPLGRRHLHFGPFFRRWAMDQSESFIIEDLEGTGAAIEFFEPESRTTEFGLRIGLAF